MAELVRTMVPSRPCSAKSFAGFVGEQVVGGDVDVQGGGPHGVGDNAVGRGWEQGRGVDEDVEAAEGRRCGLEGIGNGFAVADVDGGAGDELRGGDGLEIFSNARSACHIAVGDHDVRAAGSGEMGHFAADAAGSADDQRDAAAEFLFGRLAANLGLFQRPVFDAEGFDGGQGDVVGVDLEAGRIHAWAALGNGAGDLAFGEQGCAFHDVNGVGVELADDAGFGFVLAEAEHADALNEDDGGAGVAQRRVNRAWQRPCSRRGTACDTGPA